MCDCSSEEDSNKLEPCSGSETSADTQDLPPPFTVLQVELTKSALCLKSTSETSSSETSANSSCNCSAANDAKDEVKDLSASSTRESESLQTCVCTETCDSLASKTSIRVTENLEKIECTLAIIKPDAMSYRKDIERIIVDEAFQICQTRWLRLKPEQVSNFYVDRYDQKNFAQLVAYMSSGPIAVYIISKMNAIDDWKMLMGPEKVKDAKIFVPGSIRARYGTAGDEIKNVVHGSANEKEAEREIHFFFPDRIIEPILQENGVEEYFWKEINDLLTQGLVKCCEAKPEDPVVWLGNWLLDNNVNGPKYLLRYKSNLYD